MMNNKLDNTEGIVTERFRDRLLTLPPLFNHAGRTLFISSGVVFTIFVFAVGWQNKILADIYLSNLNGPAVVHSTSSGAVVTLNRQGGAYVNKGDHLFTISSLNEVSSIDAASQYVEELRESIQLEQLPPEPPQLASLGEATSAYLALSSSVRSYRQNMRLDRFATEIAGYKERQRVMVEKGPILERRLQIATESLNLAFERLQTYRDLIVDGSASQSELLDQMQRVSAAKLALTSVKLDINSSDEEMAQIEAGLNQLYVQQSVEKAQWNLNIRNLLVEFDAAVAEWRNRHEAYAPIDGRVQFYNRLHTFLLVEEGEELAVVIPESRAIVGVALVTARSQLRAESGQSAFIELDGYPSAMFGRIKGKVTRVSGVVHDGYYRIEIELLDGLITQSGKAIEFTEGMTGRVVIYTERRSLFDSIITRLGFAK